MNKFVALGVGAALSVLASTANAAFLEGSFSTVKTPGSTVTPVDNAWTATTLDLATGLTFGTANGSNFLVDEVFGSFVGLISTGQGGLLANFQFSPTLSPSPLDPLWSVGGLTFIATSVIVDDQDADTLTLKAYGTINDGVGGFDDTPGVWDFSLNKTSQAISFSFSTASNVPEPAALALLGVGLLGLGVARQRRT